MDELGLFTAALGLGGPWRVTRSGCCSFSRRRRPHRWRGRRPVGGSCPRDWPLGVTNSPTRPIPFMVEPTVEGKSTRTAGAPGAPRSGSGAAAPPAARVAGGPLASPTGSVTSGRQHDDDAWAS
jgi:hypothetical protein